MKSGRLLLIAFAVCIFFTFLQRDNLKSIWQEYWAIHRSYKDSRYTPKIPAIDRKIEKLDPEAAAIINYKLNFIPKDKKEVLKPAEEITNDEFKNIPKPDPKIKAEVEAKDKTFYFEPNNQCPELPEESEEI